MRLVEIRPVPRERWDKKVGKEVRIRPHIVYATVDGSTMRYRTGLKEEGVYDDPRNTGGLCEIDFYASLLRADLSPIANGNEESFWISKQVRTVLEPNAKFFNLDNPLEYIRYKLCLESGYVATGLSAYQNGLYPNATH